MMLQTVTIAQAPASVTAASVNVSPLSEAITIAGNYSGTGGSVSVDLECHRRGQSDVRSPRDHRRPDRQ
jgi:hypothetical protein